MNNSHLLILLKESGLSPEQLAERLGLSNMTIRRWIKKPPHAALPKLYRQALENAVYELIAEGTLSADSRLVEAVTKESPHVSFRAAIRNLGLSGRFMDPGQGADQDRWIVGLSQIGSDQTKVREVEKNWERISKFKKWSAEWARRITMLCRVIRSKNTRVHGKLVAYGSLFYLICPLDLILDSVPVIGYVDDFAVLGMAAGFFAGSKAGSFFSES